MLTMRSFARFVTLLSISALCLGASAPEFKVTKKYPVPGDGGFDYVTFDGAANHLPFPRH